MRWIAERSALLLACALAACAAPLSASSPPESVAVNNKSSSRIPAPKVAPVVTEGVRYQQVGNGLLAGFEQMGGYLAAHDAASGTLLWTLRVYDNRRVPGKEGDVQDVFFKSMVLQGEDTLLIENERGGRYVVDLKTRTAKNAP